MFSVWAPSTPVRTPGCCLGTGTTAGGGFATTAACLLMNVCLERSQVFQKSFDVRNPSMCPCPTQKDGRPLNQTNAAWDMIFAVRESGGKKGEWMEVHTFYLKEVLDYHASHTKRTPVTTNYPCPLSRPTSAGFACLTSKCHRKKWKKQCRWLILMCTWQASSASGNNHRVAHQPTSPTVPPRHPVAAPIGGPTPELFASNPSSNPSKIYDIWYNWYIFVYIYILI